jgi:hypothetical protein
MTTGGYGVGDGVEATGYGVPGTGPGYGSRSPVAMTSCTTAAAASRTTRQMIVIRVKRRTPRG